MTRKPGAHEVKNRNRLHPVGTAVRYWPGFKSGPGVEALTTSEAMILPSGVAAVWVEGRRDCIALTHVEAIGADEAVTP